MLCTRSGVPAGALPGGALLPLCAASASVQAALAEVTAERDALKAQCDALASELREAKLRDASLRKMIGLALAEAIPPSTEVRGVKFEHAPADN